MRRAINRLAVPLALVVALAAPVAASAQVSAPAAAEAREQGFDAREALGPDVTLDQSGPAEGLFRVELENGRSVTTHGPDTTAAAGEHGTFIGPGDPERPPACATTNAQHVLYAAPADQASRYPEVVPEIRAIVRRMNAVLNSESLESGGPEVDYRALCDGAGEIRVDTFTAPAGSQSFDAVVSAARAAGFDEPGIKYSIFYESDAAGYCGTGSLYTDDRPTADNPNNSTTRSSYALTYDGCWDGDTPMHENGHNMGAVQPGAPKSTGTGMHCYQRRDVMCYSPDGGDRNQGGEVLECDDHKHYDCGHDDYFDTAPEPGEYLASHWNVGSTVNRFLAFGGSGANAAPRADFTVSCTELACAFADATSDPDGSIAARAWSFGDRSTSSATRPTHTFPGPGAYDVSLTVTDDRGATSTTTRPLTVAEVNDRPVARDDAAVAEKSVARDMFPAANDSDPDGDPLSIVAVSDPARGGATVSPDGRSVRYTPDPGRTGVDSFAYTVSDGRGSRATATVTVTVRDTVAPRVTGVSPANGSARVSPAADVVARFSEPMRAATVNGTTVRLVRRGATTKVRATVAYSTAARSATLDPRSRLARGATYTATVGRGTTDRSGNAAASARSWSFTVRR